MSDAARLYLDHAATSFPKAPGVVEAMIDYQTRLGASPGRGAYAEARESAAILTQCRERINTLINGSHPDHVIFTLNTTDALNLAIKGLVRDGDHVITTALDHNSVLRPFNALAARNNVRVTHVACDPITGLVDPAEIEAAITPDTRLIACVHGSNVTGTLQPIRAIGAIALERDVPFLVDAAQTCGHLPIDIEADHIDLLAAPGHKGLLGPLGTGFLYIRPGMEQRMVTVREGGTGSKSELDVQPDFMPDRFEAGSHNAIGIAGLNASVGWILDHAVDMLWQHERALIEAMVPMLHDVPGLTLLGPQTAEHRCAVFSIRIEGFDDPNALADLLENEHGLLTRPGLHCAPLAHQTMGTHQQGGTTRLSLGHTHTLADVQRIANALNSLIPALR